MRQNGPYFENRTRFKDDFGVFGSDLTFFGTYMYDSRRRDQTRCGIGPVIIR